MTISLIEFSVENFRIFKERATFLMYARKSARTFEENEEHLLRTSLIYGPNASGKTTLLQGFTHLCHAVVRSASAPEITAALYQPFALGADGDQPVFYEVIFSLGKKVFRYNFSCTGEKFVTENLLEILISGKEKAYLTRKEQTIRVFSELKKSESVIQKTREDVLFLSVASQWNNRLAMQIADGFKDVKIIDGRTDNGGIAHTAGLIEQGRGDEIVEYLQRADFCIENVEVEPPQYYSSIVAERAFSPEQTKKAADLKTVSLFHSRFDDNGRKVGVTRLNILDESAGTGQFFGMLGFILDALENGSILWIDEFDNSIHPRLTKLIIELFEHKNPKNAQLVVTTHDTSLLAHKMLNKEQIWFTEKNRCGAAKLFPLSEFKIRNDMADLDEKYLEGRFGALPFVSWQ